MSRSRLCAKCGHDLLADNIFQMQAHTGPNFTQWRHGMAHAVGARIVQTPRGVRLEFDPTR